MSLLLLVVHVGWSTYSFSYSPSSVFFSHPFFSRFFNTSPPFSSQHILYPVYSFTASLPPSSPVSSIRPPFLPHLYSFFPISPLTSSLSSSILDLISVSRLSLTLPPPSPYVPLTSPFAPLAPPPYSPPAPSGARHHSSLSI
jgi:hypothetical protein